MYAYDELDRTLINERVSEFRDQVKRRLSGELTEDEFKMLRLQNGVYLQLHAYMFRVAIPYGTLSSKQLRALAHVARQIRSRLRPFHHPAEHPVQLDQARRTAGCAGRSRRRRHSRHADLGQQHPQRHLGPMGRRGARRDRGSPHLVRAAAAVHHAASGILLPAAQVQIRDHRVRSRSRGDQGARYRPAALQERRRRNRLRGAGRRRPRPHALHRQNHQAVRARPRSPELCRGDPARLQPVRPPRQYLQGAHQDPGARTRHREVRQGSRGRMAADARQRAGDRRCRDRGHPFALHLSGLRKAAAHAGRVEEGGA